MSCPLGSDFFSRDCVVVARELVGTKLVIDKRFMGEIVETEAYCARRDRACHGFRGKTPRNAALFGSPGSIYVYQIYGIHHCLNFVTGLAGEGAAVLIRAIRPVFGMEACHLRRKVRDEHNLCNGPGKLCQALGIDLKWNGKSMADAGISISPFKQRTVKAGSRIGISKDVDLPWRFGISNSLYISRKI